jgi:hypothetical protein
MPLAPEVLQSWPRLKHMPTAAAKEDHARIFTPPAGSTIVFKHQSLE